MLFIGLIKGKQAPKNKTAAVGGPLQAREKAGEAGSASPRRKTFKSVSICALVHVGDEADTVFNVHASSTR
jgi:hypothetical protein